MEPTQPPSAKTPGGGIPGASAADRPSLPRPGTGVPQWPPPTPPAPRTTDGIGTPSGIPPAPVPRLSGGPSFAFRGASGGGSTFPPGLLSTAPPSAPQGPSLSVSGPSGPRGGKVRLWLAVVSIIALVAISGLAWVLRPQTPVLTDGDLALPEPFVSLSAPSAAPDARYVYRDGSSIVPPAGWITDTSAGPTLFKKQTVDQDATESTTATISMHVETLAEGTTLDQFVSRWRRDISTQDGSRHYVPMDDAPVVTVEGKSAHIIGGTYELLTPNHGYKLRDKQLLVVSGSTGYVVTGTALASARDAANYNALFDAVLTTFMAP